MKKENNEPKMPFELFGIECGSGWNYIYRVNLGNVAPIVPLTVGKLVNRGANGAVTGGRWKDNQFLVSLEFVGTDAMQSGVGRPVIEYQPE